MFDPQELNPECTDDTNTICTLVWVFIKSTLLHHDYHAGTKPLYSGSVRVVIYPLSVLFIVCLVYMKHNAVIWTMALEVPLVCLGTVVLFPAPF